MMGERTMMQEALFYEFSIERHIPADHLRRALNRFVDLSDLRVKSLSSITLLERIASH